MNETPPPPEKTRVPHPSHLLAWVGKSNSYLRRAWPPQESTLPPPSSSPPGTPAPVPPALPPAFRKLAPSQTAARFPNPDSNSTPACRASPAPSMSASPPLPRSADFPTPTLVAKFLCAPAFLGGAALPALRFYLPIDSRL